MSRLSRGYDKNRVQNSLSFLRSRELGDILFNEQCLTARYYKFISKTFDWRTAGDTDHGSVFNFDFPPNGRLLAAACERQTILLLDPLSRSLVKRISPAHGDCVNCVRFLDERLFASASDDRSIIVWDARMLRDHVIKLMGHTNMVKNLAYHQSSARLISSGYDDTVRLWNINTYDNDPRGETVLKVERLSRSQLSPSGDKLVIATFGDSLIVYHNLDFDTLQADVLRQQRGENLCGHAGNPRNLVEHMTDFPHEPWYISSLQVHPTGRYVVSRYTSGPNYLEFTAVHEILNVPHATLHKCPGENARKVGRLCYYTGESNAAKSYIKEQYFSKDGRIIASPFGNGTRLLAFNTDCDEPCADDGLVTRPKQLHEINYLLSHRSAVCCSKFSPTHTILVTGCLGGHIVFHEPNFS